MHELIAALLWIAKASVALFVAACAVITAGAGLAYLAVHREQRGRGSPRRKDEEESEDCAIESYCPVMPRRRPWVSRCVAEPSWARLEGPTDAAVVEELIERTPMPRQHPA